MRHPAAAGASDAAPPERENAAPLSRTTRGIRAGIGEDTGFGAVTPPIYLSSNFQFAGYDEPRDYDYTRSGNPTRDTLGRAIAELEGGAGGTVTASGMAAVSLSLWALMPAGGTVVVPHDCYGGTWRLFDHLAKNDRLTVITVDFGDAASLDQALDQHSVDVVWIETPSNPLLRITDISLVTQRAHAAGALVVADNTFLSPILQRPLERGVDVVVHSTTKYLNGHSDVVGGVVVAARPELHELFGETANLFGITGSPFDSYLTTRGLRTVAARMRLHEENTARIVAAVAGHPAIAHLYYPGLETHPGHQIALRQQDGFGAMMSIDLVGGVAAVRAFLDGLRVFLLAESLGGVESLVAHPATMTHASMSAEARAHAGITDGLLRFSVGIEAAEDLVRDFTDGLDRAAQVR